MVELKLKVGEKGHILIPKILREKYGINEGEFVTVRPTEEGLLIKGKPSFDYVKKMLDEHVELLKKKGVTGPKLGDLRHVSLEMEFERA